MINFKLVCMILLQVGHPTSALVRHFETNGLPYLPSEVRRNNGEGNGFSLFSQRVDHFHPTNVDVWDQVYYLDDRYYQQDGPVFFFVGGESPLSHINFSRPLQWVTWAKEFNALMVMLEHRFYGISQPFFNMTTDKMAYLTIDQALADAAQFHEHITEKRNLTADTKWMVFGGSYPGSLAAWLRMTYPHLFHGSVASSAPILATLEFSDYMRVVTEDMSKHCANIVPAIQKAFADIESSMKAPNGTAVLKQTFNLCDGVNFSLADDQNAFFEQVMAPYQDAAQYGAMDRLCYYLKSGFREDLQRRMATLARRTTYGFNCLASYDQIIKALKKTDAEGWSNRFSMRQWIYQTCTEMGYFQTTRSEYQKLSKNLRLQYFIKMCNDIFDMETNEHLLSEAIIRTNVMKGGRLPSMSNVIFVNGLEDPWHALSLLEPSSKFVETVIIKGGSHCQDMLNNNPSDSQELKAARMTIFKFLARLLHE